MNIKNTIAKTLLTASAWIRNPCKFRHRWINKSGSTVSVTARERMALRDSVLFKDPRHGWLRYERVCKRCTHRQYLRVLDKEGQKAEWHDV